MTDPIHPGQGRGKRKKLDLLRPQAIANLEVSHERRRADHDLASAIARRGGAARHRTPEEKAEHMARMRAARAAHQANLTPEERAEVGRRISATKRKNRPSAGI